MSYSTEPPFEQLGIDEYQVSAGRTEQPHSDPVPGLAFPLLGLIGETGTLLSALKKKQRDGEAYDGYRAAYLWNEDRALALSCVGAVVTLAQETHQAWENQRAQPLLERQSIEPDLASIRLRVRESIEERRPANEAQITGLDLTTFPGRAVAVHLLALAASHSDDPVAAEIFRRQVDALPNLWHLERQGGRRSRRGADEQSFDPQIEHELVKAICRFSLRLPSEAALTLLAPLLALTAEFPAKAADFVNWLILTQGDNPEASTLWALWQAFADSFRNSPLVSTVDDERSPASKLLHELLLGANWKEQRDWIPLHSDLHRVRALAEALPPSRRLIRFYCYFLAHIGSPALPDALIGIKANSPCLETQISLTTTPSFTLNKS